MRLIDPSLIATLPFALGAGAAGAAVASGGCTGALLVAKILLDNAPAVEWRMILLMTTDHQ